MKDLPTHNTRLLVEDIIKDDPEYRRLVANGNKLAAYYLLSNAITEVELFLTKTYPDYRDTLRQVNRYDPPKVGRIVAEVPYIFLRIIAHKIGHEPDWNEVMQFVKQHKEFWTVDKL